MESLPENILEDLEILWDYHNMHHEPRHSDIGIGLGSHDIGVAVFAAELFGKGFFPRIVFTGANAPTTIERFPRGEAVHYREEAVRLGVPVDRILVETRATNTGQNIEFTRTLLADHGIGVSSVTLVSRPYQQRRAYATCKKLWPEVEVTCASASLPLADYIGAIGDADRVANMIVGDTQRISKYAELGFAIPQEMSDEVRSAYDRLVVAGYTSRLTPSRS
ncbi:YdcF family protein [Streptosporangium sp. NPDC000563]|uniref:YdcF family protein n=1 Tax=Streptosporangium sp. NPDC000563 TaxID=3154366 RepID=UPI003330B5BB